MKSDVVSIAQLEEFGRWRVELFIKDSERDTIDTSCPMVPLDSICSESSEAIDPPQAGPGSFIYIGLENVESVTGDIVGELEKPRGAVKSRSKRFRKGDVLYGRLRPSLRKVVCAPVDALCSTEFIVLRPNAKVSAPVLRAILASRWVSGQLEKLQVGAALPRVSSRDLLAMKVPVPDGKAQRKLELALDKLETERRAAKEIVAAAADHFEAAVIAALT